ncbi:MAG: electron transfer flavoprotein subunit alpha/FixB family protein [Gemmatimonadetes bacterium]|nr:electron transfer flavoprotein subunit alpha/FixB family protein [Gemmatimonadota bacterium]
MANVLALAEQRDGKLKKVSEEVVSAARTLADALGGRVEALVLGPAGVADVAAGLARFGADRIWAVEHDAFAKYEPDGFAQAVSERVRADDYFAVLFPADSLGKDLAPRVAARLDLPLATDATALSVADGELIITRPVYAGRAFARVVLEATPRLVSLRPNVFRPEERPRAGEVQRLEATTSPEQWRVRMRELVAASAARPDVGEASIIVSGGRGLQSPEHWHLLEALCEAMGPQCTLGASRAVVDAGWRPHAEQVGQTGKTVQPQLYIAVGISGAMQHLAGMRSAKTIVAINKDPDAPIFKVADYGIVGDAFEVLPRLTEEVRKLRGQ